MSVESCCRLCSALHTLIKLHLLTVFFIVETHAPAGVFHASSQMPRSRLLGELGHLPASARSGIKIAQFGPDFDIDLYHQSIASLLDDRSAVDQRLAIAPADKLKGTGHDPSTQTYETTALVDGGDKARQPPAAAPKLGFQISQTSNTTKTVFDAAGYEPPPPLDQVIRGDYRGGRGQGQGMIQILSIGPSRAGLPLHVHDESFLHLLGGLKLWVSFGDEHSRDVSSYMGDGFCESPC